MQWSSSPSGPGNCWAGPGAAAVRALCEKDLALDHALCLYVAEVIADRLRAARVRLLDLHGPHGAGEVP